MATEPTAQRSPAREIADSAHLSPLPSTGWWLPGAFLLLTLVGGVGVALLQPATWQWPREGSFWHGEQAATYEKAFNEALPFRDAAVATWGVLEYALFREGLEGVVVGREGWLFTNEEVTFYSDASTETARKLAFIKQVRNELRDRNIGLIVALVPDKSRVYAEFVGRALPRYTENRYAAFRKSLTAAGILAPDLLAPLLRAKAQTQVYLRTDTHWTPAGAEVAATALAKALVRAGIAELFASDYTTAVTGEAAYRGDLLNFLPLGALQARLGPAPDRLESRQTTAASAAGGLFGSQSVPVTLIGTSYSADDRWNFSGALQTALGADVLNLASEGQGPLPPMRAYLESPEFKDAPPSLVVWEIPERYLPAPPPREPPAREGG